YPHQGVDVLKLCVPIRVPRSFQCLAVALQTVIRRVQQPSHRGIADRVPVPRQFARQGACALAGPTQGGIGIATRHRVHQLLQGLHQFRILLGQAFGARSWTTQPSVDGQVRLRGAGGQLGLCFTNRGAREAGGLAHGLDTAPAIGRRFGCRPLSPHPFVHQRRQGAILRCNPLNERGILHHHVRQWFLVKSNNWKIQLVIILKVANLTGAPPGGSLSVVTADKPSPGGARCKLPSCGCSGKPSCCRLLSASPAAASSASSSGSPAWPSTSRSTPSPSPSSAWTESTTGRPWSPSPSTAPGTSPSSSGAWHVVSTACPTAPGMATRSGPATTPRSTATA